MSRGAVTLTIELIAEGVCADFEQVHVFGHSFLLKWDRIRPYISYQCRYILV